MHGAIPAKHHFQAFYDNYSCPHVASSGRTTTGVMTRCALLRDCTAAPHPCPFAPSRQV
jgi:hypothetical protein